MVMGSPDPGFASPTAAPSECLRGVSHHVGGEAKYVVGATV